jgi:hypothetical protein
MWSRSFRQIEQIKKFYIDKNAEGELQLSVEFTFNLEIRKILTSLAKTCENLTINSSGRNCAADLTEQNIIILFDTLKPFDFEIDPVIQDYYNTIKSWSRTEIESKFLLTNIEHKTFQKTITDDLGIETPLSQNIINDRSMRYQYLTTNIKNVGENLTEIIANRSRPRVWIDKNKYSFSEVIASMLELQRLPIMIVFDTVVNSKYYENLKILSESLENNNIKDHIGIYFRLPSDDVGRQFNQLIAEKRYNYNLADDTVIAGVMSGKLPKFFLKNNWRPMSIITMDTKMGLRHGKTSVYANCCDLIVEWAEAPTMFENKVIKR